MASRAFTAMLTIALAERPAQHVGDADDVVVELDDLSIHMPSTRKGQKLIGELRSEYGRVLRLLEQQLVLVPIQLLIQEFKIAGNDQQQVVEVVRDTASELTDRLHLLGLRQAPFALAQRLLNVLTVTQVMDHTGKIPPAVGRELTDREMQRKGRAVLAAAADLAANADDLLHARPQVIGDVAVMLRLV
jgi:hypothetical protein